MSGSGCGQCKDKRKNLGVVISLIGLPYACTYSADKHY